MCRDGREGMRAVRGGGRLRALADGKRLVHGNARGERAACRHTSIERLWGQGSAKLLQAPVADGAQVRHDGCSELVAQGRFPGKLDESVMRQLAPSYSMFRILVNVVGEKSRWVENL